MSSNLALQPEPLPVAACTISRNVTNFDLLISDMETEMGERWGDLSFRDALTYFDQPDAGALEFIVVAVDAMDESEIGQIATVISRARSIRIDVLLVARDLSPASIHQLMECGANELLPYPLPENALHQAVERLGTPIAAETSLTVSSNITDIAVHTGGTHLQGAVFAVHGLAGGVGASTFAVNLAHELAHSGRHRAPRVCLLDLDLQMGSASTFLDLPRRESVYELLSDTETMDREGFLHALQPLGERLHVLTAPSEMLPLDIIDQDDVAKLLSIAQSCFDVVIIDMPTVLIGWTETVLQNANIYFALLERDMRSAQNTMRFIRLLKSEALPTQKIRYVMNRAPKFSDLQGKSRVRRLAESMEIDIELMLPDGQKQVTQANDQGTPICAVSRKNPLHREISRLAASLHDLLAAETETG